MKKFLLALSSTLIISANAFALECPPASALSHKAAGKFWSVETKYASQGWYVSQMPQANNVPVASLDQNPLLSVELSADNHDDVYPSLRDTYYMVCSYSQNTIPGSASNLRVVVTNNTGVKIQPHTVPTNYYLEYPPNSDSMICQTESTQPGRCAVAN